MSAASVRVTVDIGAGPATAFTAFTKDISAWYRRGPHTFFDPERAVGIRFEPHVGGRLVEVYDGETGRGREMARVVVWQPPRRVVFVDHRETEVEVRFEPATGGTRVTLEHRGLDRLDPEVAAQVERYGWGLLLPWFAQHLSSR